MRQKSVPEKEPATEVVKKVRRATRFRPPQFPSRTFLGIILITGRNTDAFKER
jgi:hypothetical protein